jgi:hypothetical protein
MSTEVRWLVENFSGDESYSDLIAEVKNQGMQCHVLNITNHFELKPEVFDGDDACVVFQGSIQMFRKLKKETNLRPLGWMTDDNYLCTKYYPHFTEFLFNDKHCFVSLATLKQHKFFFYGMFGKDTMIYVRPDGGDKKFKGQLLDLADFDRMWTNYLSSEAKDSDLVMVSSPKNIVGEWRFICLATKEIVSYSTYMYQGNRTYVPSAPTEAIKLCRKILDVGYYPDPAFTVDICEDSDHNYWLMEMNSFTSAGTYAAPKKPIVEKISQLALAQF